MEENKDLCNVVAAIAELNAVMTKLNAIKGKYELDLIHVKAAVKECTEAVGEAIQQYSSQNSELPF